MQQEYAWAYKVEVECLQQAVENNESNFNSSISHLQTFKKFRMEHQKVISQEDMPPREIAIEYFRMAVYVFWKQQPDKHILKL